jgi:hypothetical protein
MAVAAVEQGIDDLLDPIDLDSTNFGSRLPVGNRLLNGFLVAGDLFECAAYFFNCGVRATA